MELIHTVVWAAQTVSKLCVPRRIPHPHPHPAPRTPHLGASGHRRVLRGSLKCPSHPAGPWPGVSCRHYRSADRPIPDVQQLPLQ